MAGIRCELVGRKLSSFPDKATGELVINNHAFVNISGIEDKELVGIQCVDYPTKCDLSNIQLGEVQLSFVPRGKTMALCGIVNI